MNMVTRFPHYGKANSIAFELSIRIAGTRQLKFDMDGIFFRFCGPVRCNYSVLREN